MILKFKQENINIIFEITEDNKLYFLKFSNSDFAEEVLENRKKFYPAIELHISGENQNDHHGAKNTATSSSLSLEYKSHKYYKNEFGNKLEFFLEDKFVLVVLHYQFYDGISVVRSWNETTNISDCDVGLEYVSSFALTGIDEGDKNANDKMLVYIPHNSWVREGAWTKQMLSELGFDKITKFSTKRINISNTGAWSTKEYLPMGAVTNIQTDTTYLWQIENNGSWHWEIGDIADAMYLKLGGPCERENHWYKCLKPNKTFKSVKTAVCVGNDFDSALEEMTKYRRKIVRKNKKDEKLPVIFNDYMNCLWADPTEEKMIPIIDKAYEAGAEYYCMDAGWYADGKWWDSVGNWQPVDWRFPNGIKRVFDYIKSKNMIPGIWLEIEVMGINCPSLNQFDDECFFMRHGKRVIDHGRYQLDFRSKKVREFATSVVDRMVNEYGVGYIKMDYNIEPGIGTEINSDSFGDGLLEHNRALVGWIDSILDKYPDLIIENCASGGMRMDYVMLSHYTLQSVSDQEEYINTGIISSNAPIAVLPEQSAIWSYPKKNDDEDATVYNMVSPLLCRMHLSGQISNLSNEQFKCVKDGVELYKSIRRKISDFIPFYPLGINSFSKNIACVGYKHKSELFFSIWKKDGDVEDIVLDGNYKSANIIYPLAKNNIDVFVSENKLTIKNMKKGQAFVINAIKSDKTV